MNGVFLNLNRNKQSIVVDLKLKEGQELVLRLCRDADVFVSSIRPDSARRLGLDYELGEGGAAGHRLLRRLRFRRGRARIAARPPMTT